MKRFIRKIVREEILRREAEKRKAEEELKEAERLRKINDDAKHYAREYYKKFLKEGYIHISSHRDNELITAVIREFNNLFEDDLHQRVIKTTQFSSWDRQISISEELKNDLQKLSPRFTTT